MGRRGRQQDPDAPALLAETADTEVNLDPAWITKIAFEQKVNGSWETLMGNEVESGTNVQVTMTYKLPAGTLTPDRRTLCYQLPDAMKPKQPTSGEIKDETDNNKVIGTYTIDTDGLAKLTFDKSDKFTGLDAKGNGSLPEPSSSPGKYGQMILRITKPSPLKRAIP